MKRSTILVLSGLAAAACGGATSGTKTPAAAPDTASCSGISNAQAISDAAAGSTLALAKIDGRRVAFVADEDAKAIHTVDVDTRVQIATTPVGGTPAQVFVTKDGRVLATVRDRNVIVALAVTKAELPLSRLCARPTPVEPIAIAASPDGATVVVSAGWAQRVATFDGKTLAAKREVKVPREPRSVVVSDDGRTALVSHAVGSKLTAVALDGEAKSVSLAGRDLAQVESLNRMQRELTKEKANAKDKARIKAQLEELDRERDRVGDLSHPTCQGFALAKSSAVPGRVFAPQVFVNPGDVQNQTEGYGDGTDESETPSIAVIDEDTVEPFEASLDQSALALRSLRSSRDARDPHPDCLLPRAATIDAKSKWLLVTCYGIDSVIAYDARSPNPLAAERRRWTVGSGPSGIAVDVEKHRAVVWSQFDRTIATFPIGGLELADEKVAPPLVLKTALAPLTDKLPPEYQLGRILFHAGGDTRISSDGRACASCHPDGRDDAITWATPDGPRRSIMLAGRVMKSAPYSWNGDENSIPNHLGNTFDRLNGKGLRSIELDALVAYVAAMPAPPPSVVTDKRKTDRGAKIFASQEAGCAGCHSGAGFTDGKNHDVGSKHVADRNRAFNTPSLHFVGGTGPWFHDGRYDSLQRLLRESDGKMGKTKHLSDDDLDALESYLRTL